ncbi:MAG: class I SAM-dependent methyltransferase [Flavobacteriaceae bacterium]|jgi:ubiquinone/menaquinone biosynthesis C-methylase UbiE|nr:class I SAM-dependent methyltransferase [Flavobacteriaceae bacterium]
MDSKQLISREIELFYNKASEETRLDKGMGVFEFERIKSLIERYITSSPLTILDIGGGTGKYSEWLAKKGHKVHMIDPVSKHIKIAHNRASKLKNKFSVHIGESRKLEFSNNYADLIILHGPLYHLQEKEDRELSIREAKRVLKNNGIILGFAINYTASTLVGLMSGLIYKKSFFEMCKDELTDGRHNPPDDFSWLLAEAFYHKPDDLKEEFINEELTYLNTYAVEGMSWLDKDFFVNMANPAKCNTLMELIALTENDKYLLPFSPHMMIAVQKKYNNGK